MQRGVAALITDSSCKKHQVVLKGYKQEFCSLASSWYLTLNSLDKLADLHRAFFGLLDQGVIALVLVVEQVQVFYFNLLSIVPKL